MNQQEKKQRQLSAYIKRLRKAVVSLRDELSRESRRPDVLAFPNPDWGLATFGGWEIIYQRKGTRAAIEQLEAIILDALKLSDWSEKWSSKHVREIVGGAIGRGELARLAEDDATALILNMMAELDEVAQEWYSYFTVGGVYFEGELRFGHYRCFRMLEPEFERIMETLRQILETTPHSKAEKEQKLGTSREQLSSLQNMACIEVRVKGGDEWFLREQADELVDEAVDFLQVMAEAFGRFPPTKIIAGQLPYRVPPYVLIRTDQGHAIWRQDLRHTHRVTVNAAILEQARQSEFGVLIDALSKDRHERTEFESALLTSMHWIADSGRQTSPPNKITSAVTAVELFFTIHDAPIRRDVAEGAAIVVGQTPKARRDLERMVTRAYSERSGVSHRGERKIADQSVNEIRLLALNLLARMCRLKPRFKKVSDVRDWLAELRLAASYEDAPEERAPTIT